MEPHTPAEELPALYRAILDRVALLEVAGERAEAANVRREATRAYSRAWDERARGRLKELLRHAERSATPQEPRREPRRPRTRPSTAATQDR